MIYRLASSQVIQPRALNLGFFYPSYPTHLFHVALHSWSVPRKGSRKPAHPDRFAITVGISPHISLPIIVIAIKRLHPSPIYPVLVRESRERSSPLEEAWPTGSNVFDASRSCQALHQTLFRSSYATADTTKRMAPIAFLHYCLTSI